MHSSKYTTDCRFGKWLIRNLRENDMTQAELADELGVSIPRINQIVHGNGAPSIPNLVRMCDILGVTDYEEPLRAIYEDDMKKAFHGAA